MKKIEAEKLLRQVRLELARDHEFPNGSRERGYDFIAPLLVRLSRGALYLALLSAHELVIGVSPLLIRPL